METVQKHNEDIIEKELEKCRQDNNLQSSLARYLNVINSRLWYEVKPFESCPGKMKDRYTEDAKKILTFLKSKKHG